MEDKVPRFLCAALIAAASISAAPALAQDSYPNKPIKIVLPVPPGSALDIATRAIGEQLSVRWGQQVLIEARPGAGGLIACPQTGHRCCPNQSIHERTEFAESERKASPRGRSENETSSHSVQSSRVTSGLSRRRKDGACVSVACANS